MESKLQFAPTERAPRQTGQWARRNQSLATRYRAKLGDLYPAAQAEKVKYAEAFELCEYGAQPDKAELKRLFPFFE